VLPGLGAQEFSILFTNSSNGVIENCYCPDAKLGGLEKRAQFIATYRQTHPDVLVVDNGDNYIEYLAPGFDKVINAVLKMMDYDIINPGDQDIAYASDEYFDLEALVSVHGEPVEAKKGDITFSILPVLHKSTTRFYPEFVFAEMNLEDVPERIERWVESEGKGSVFRILLSHSGLDVDRAIAAAYPEIDLIIGGHSQSAIDTPVVVSGVPIVQAGGYAGYVGEIRFKPAGDDYVLTHHELHALPPEAPDHPEVMKLIDEYVSSP
jgi:2',3'-cyclic-nucleotide 2'-phosphodiesterase (5'-nucleotidase family)